MVQTAARGSKSKRSTGLDADASDDLPYVIELWNRSGTSPLRVIARAQNATLARAIFKAASEENPKRKLTLRRNERSLATTE
jgi:predicted ATP-grasp superfamily ATP-dependent carboligase